MKKKFHAQIWIGSEAEATECKSVIGGEIIKPSGWHRPVEFGVYLDTDDATDAMGYINDANNWIAFQKKQGK